MINSNNFELLNLGNTINTIDKNSLPQSFPIHWHRQVELIFMPENADSSQPPVIQVGQDCFKMYPGDLVIIWAGELHSVVSNATHQLCGLQFSSSVLLDIPDFSPYIHYYKTIKKLEYEQNTHLLQSLQINLQQILKLSTSQTPFRKVQQTILLLESFIYISEHLHALAKESALKSPSLSNDTAVKIQEACIYINENCEKDLSLNQIADQIGFSASYFSKMFRKVTSYHYVEYLNLQRLKYSQILLSDFALPITEVAYQSGFKSISSFNRIFRQQFGLSPSVYRKLYANTHIQ